MPDAPLESDMPKKLILFRHAKSDWTSGAASDHARPLARRGMEAARVMGKFLMSAGEVPEQILCSSAVRAVAIVAREEPEVALVR